MAMRRSGVNIAAVTWLLLALLAAPAAAQIALQGTPQSANCGSCSSNTGLTISMPSGVVAGNVCVATVSYLGAQGAPTEPSGWTQKNSQADSGGGIILACHDGTNSEPANYQWTWGGNAFPAGVISCYAGAKACASEFEVAAGNSGSSTAPQWNTITTTTANDWLIAGGLFSSDGTHTVTETCPASFTQEATLSAAVGGAFGTNYCDQGPVAAGATGNQTATLNFSTNWGTLHAALIPAATSTATATPTATATATATSTGTATPTATATPRTTAYQGGAIGRPIVGGMRSDGSNGNGLGIAWHPQETPLPYVWKGRIVR